MTQYCSEDTGTELLRRHQGEECLGVLKVFCAWCFFLLFLLSFAASSPIYPRKVNQCCLHSPFNATSLPAGLLWYVTLPVPENA